MAVARALADGPLIAGGHSYAGRQTSMAVADEGPARRRADVVLLPRASTECRNRVAPLVTTFRVKGHSRVKVVAYLRVSPVLDELSKICSDKSMDALVFPGRDGAYLPRPKSNGGWFVGAVKRAKVQSVTPHDLRHTCASLAVSAGVSVLALQRMLGHKSAKVTLDTYADLYDDDWTPSQ